YSIYIRSFLLSLIPPLLRSTLFPYTTLFRSNDHTRFQSLSRTRRRLRRICRGLSFHSRLLFSRQNAARSPTVAVPKCQTQPTLTDRKSTRLNSSHVAISYAVFCLKKKKTKNT